MDVTERLDPNSPTALHEQLTNRLRTFIDEAEDERRLPSESALASGFDVSRATVRRALGTLVAEGSLCRHQGRGTFIARPRAIRHLDRLGPFVESFDADDAVATRLLAFEWLATSEVPQALEAPGDALMFERLYLTGDDPHALVRVTLPEQIGRRVTRAQIEEHPLYHVLRDDLGLVLREARMTVWCGPAPKRVSRALGTPADAALLVAQRVTLDDAGRPVELTNHFLRPDVYQLELTARGAALPRLIRLPAPPGDR